MAWQPSAAAQVVELLHCRAQSSSLRALRAYADWLSCHAQVKLRSGRAKGFDAL
jgi:hypothetical protein